MAVNSRERTGNVHCRLSQVAIDLPVTFFDDPPIPLADTLPIRRQNVDLVAFGRACSIADGSSWAG
jgi:hypothetical protein